MSEENNSQDTDQEESDTFDRGSSLSLFQSDRLEDTLALLFALAVALYVYVSY